MGGLTSCARRLPHHAPVPSGNARLNSIGVGGDATATEEDFSRWCGEVLTALANGTEQMTPAALSACPSQFAGYKFSGPLRPAFVSPQLGPPPGCALPEYALHPKGIPRSEFLRSRTKDIPVLEGAELASMRESCRLGREVLDVASRFVRAGVTGDAIDRVVWQACAERGVYPSPLNYHTFPKSLCVSVNEVICHGIPDCRPLRDGDIVNLDISIYHDGFHADLSETLLVGECDGEAHALVRAAYDSLRVAAEAIRPGVLYRDLGAKIQAEAAKRGCSVVPAYTGHGVGRLFHGPPDVPHYARNKAVGTMKPGHVFTVEPMLNEGRSGGDILWPDDWTAATKDGRRSAQFEHTFLVTEGGVEVLTSRRGAERTSMPAYDPAFFQR